MEAPRRYNSQLMILLATTVGGKKFDVTGRGRVAEPAGERVSPANTPPETEKSLPLLESSVERLTQIIEHRLVNEPRCHQPDRPMPRRTSTPPLVENDPQGRVLFTLEDGQRFLYGPYSNMANCLGILRILRSRRHDQNGNFDPLLKQVSELCNLLGPQLFKVSSSAEPTRLLQLSQQAVMQATDRYLSQGSYIQHLFHPSILRSRIQMYYLGTLGVSGSGMELCLQYLMLQSNTQSKENGSDSRDHGLAQANCDDFCATARASLVQGQLQATTLVNVQALACITIIALQAEDLLLADEAFHGCCAMGQRMGLHRERQSSDEHVEEAEERRLLFWTTFILDKAIAFTLGRAYMLPSFDCSTPTPDMSLHSVPVEGLSARIGLALIQERAYQILLASGNTHNNRTRQEAITDVVDRLECWMETHFSSSEFSGNIVPGAWDTMTQRALLYEYYTTRAVVLAHSMFPDAPNEVLASSRNALSQLCPPSPAGRTLFSDAWRSWPKGSYSLFPFFIITKHILLAAQDAPDRRDWIRFLYDTISCWESSHSLRLSIALIKLVLPPSDLIGYHRDQLSGENLFWNGAGKSPRLDSGQHWASSLPLSCVGQEQRDQDQSVMNLSLDTILSVTGAPLCPEVMGQAGGDPFSFVGVVSHPESIDSNLDAIDSCLVASSPHDTLRLPGLTR
ncbi:hypothetical protein BO85DRAFT_516786 [Aspergillus piperis CBS 112811]|uniref:Xylanolytic transcriptional activator regulatory domain-containing protein n=1 Tax=Aspergillus piperis CBS 112811 TaxID=1448313 RepID=A0A8G1VRW0_9EURO|nr:hypothetical protein BO85DRAFT_516786 [Aspergillus piperis CBS 112811]RAH62257.1 hypothetical protein BO85DRAFT_516786 [Aspergillus piperis CBS 112811]